MTVDHLFYCNYWSKRKAVGNISPCSPPSSHILRKVLLNILSDNWKRLIEYSVNTRK